MLQRIARRGPLVLCPSSDLNKVGHISWCSFLDSFLEGVRGSPPTKEDLTLRKCSENPHEGRVIKSNYRTIRIGDCYTLEGSVRWCSSLFLCINRFAAVLVLDEVEVEVEVEVEFESGGTWSWTADRCSAETNSSQISLTFLVRAHTGIQCRPTRQAKTGKLGQASKHPASSSVFKRLQAQSRAIG